MRSSFSRRFGSAWPVVAIGFFFSNPTLVPAQSPQSTGTRSDSLRLRTPLTEDDKPSAGPQAPNFAPARMQNSEAVRFENPPLRDGDETGEILIIGSANTRVVNASDSAQPLFAESDSEAAIESVDLSAAVRLSLASMSHLSPWLYFFADPLSAYLREEAPEETPFPALEEIPAERSTTVPRSVVIAEPAPDDSTSSPPLTANDPPSIVEEQRSTRRSIERDRPALSAISEPSGEAFKEPDRTPKAEETIPIDSPSTSRPVTMDTRADAAEQSSRKNVAESTEEKAKRPTPRKIKLPFEEPIVEDTISGRTPTSSQTAPPERLPASLRSSPRESDSQREQEEPSIDPRTRGNDKDLQGVDALNAAKPRSNRRELKADEVSNKREAPIVKKSSIEPTLALRLQRADACFNHYLNNPESTSVRSPWAVMHAVLAYGGEYEMAHGNGRVNAIGWMCHNGTCRTQRMFTPKGRGFVPNVGGGVQGHEGQFLAILAQCNVPLDYPIQIGTSKYTVEDLVRYEMATCKEKSELTFKLIGLSYYLDSNKQWKANDGKVWSIQKLIQEEMAQPIIGSACGGTHRLMGFSFSIRQRQLQGQPISGQYARAAKFVREYVAYTLQLQNPDGSFSTSWYEGRANDPNEERKVQTSGHMLEWLMYTMTDEEIKHPKVAKGVDFLLSKIYDKRDYKWPIGPRGHATRAITLYRDRMKDLLESTPSEPVYSAAKQAPAPIIRK